MQMDKIAYGQKCTDASRKKKKKNQLTRFTKLNGNASLFRQGFAPGHNNKTTNKWLTDHGITVLDWPAELAGLT